MIKKLEHDLARPLTQECRINKINELVDKVNFFEK